MALALIRNAMLRRTSQWVARTRNVHRNTILKSEKEAMQGEIYFS